MKQRALEIVDGEVAHASPVDIISSRKKRDLSLLNLARPNSGCGDPGEPFAGSSPLSAARYIRPMGVSSRHPSVRLIADATTQPAH